jgi:hypothetical protein
MNKNKRFESRKGPNLKKGKKMFCKLKNLFLSNHFTHDKQIICISIQCHHTSLLKMVITCHLNNSLQQTI